ncbi:hypothetical protein [Caulobacter segnis]|nr:hypothetical protein [Caulobacter segnis]UAL12988.1 hypothetical protein K8940_07110 [Caulobacter segnis]
MRKTMIVLMERPSAA